MPAEADGARERLLVYDGECPLCTGLSQAYVRLGWIPARQRVPLLDLEPTLIERLLALGFGNEMAVVEPDRVTIRTGVDGLFHLLRHTWARPLVAILDVAVLRQLCELAYRFVGANRRFLSPPRPRGPACACEPDERPAFNLVLIVLATALALLVARPFQAFPILAPRTQVLVVLPVLLVAWASVPAGLRLRALGHLSMAFLHAGLILGVGALLVEGGPALGLVWAVALFWCARQLVRRLAYLGTAHVWPRSLVLALGSLVLLSAV